MNKITFLSLIVQFYWCSVFAEDDQLELVQMIYRHGDRNPIVLYPNDPNHIEDFSEGLGELTALGKRQHYMLGDALKSRYKNFITGSPNEVNALSSDVNRCLESAQCNLARLYSPPSNSIWEWNKNLSWQPIPIHTVPIKDDYVLNTDSECPVSNDVILDMWKSARGQEILLEYKDVFDAVNAVTGQEATPSSVEMVADTIKIEIWKGLKIHPKLEEVKDKLLKFAQVFFQFECSSRLIQRLRSGLLLKHLLENMENKIANRTDKKVFVYSTHDFVIAILLNALNAYSGTIPSYGSTVIMELHKNQENHTISFFYINNVPVSNNSAEIKFTPLEVNGCSSKCSLCDFKTDISSFITFEPKVDCYTPKSEVRSFRIPVILLGVFICFFVACFTIIVISRRKDKTYCIEYEPVPTN